MNHYLFKYATLKCKELFIGRRVTSVIFHSSSSFSILFKDCIYTLYVNLSSQNSFIFPTRQSLNPLKINDIAFFTFLKKRMPGLVLKAVLQSESERVVRLFFEDIRGSIKKGFVLIFEMIDRLSNAIFTDDNYIVLQAYKYIESSRHILPGRKYISPPVDMPDVLVDDFDKLALRFRYNENILGVNGAVRRFIHNEDEFKKFVKTAREAFETEKFGLYLYEKKYVYPFKFYERAKPVDEDFIFENFVLKPKQNDFRNKKNNLKKVVVKRLNSLKRRFQKVYNELKNAEDAQHYRIVAENLLINPNLDIAYKNKITIKDIYSSKDITIELNPKLNLFDNARNYFKKFKKAKKGKKIVEKRLKETKFDIKFAQQLIFDIENAKDEKDLEDIKDIMFKESILRSNLKKNKQTNYIPYEHKKIEGFDVYIGKNARGNDYVTLKLSSKNDLWFHAHERPGAHLILKNSSRLQNIDDSVKIKCAEEVAKKTKAKEGEKIDIDYTYIKYVKKPKGFKTGLVLYSNFKTLRIDKI